MTQRLPLCTAVIVIWALSSSRVISSLIVTFVCRPLVLTCCFYPTKPNYEIVADCKMHFGGVFPQCRTLPPLLEPVNRDEFPASQTVCQFCPPMCHQLGWTWLPVHPRTNPGGVPRATADPLHAQSQLCPRASTWSRRTLPLQKQTHHHGLYAGWTPWNIRKAVFLIGIRIETAEREHELMKEKGCIFCPCVFCLVPAEKRDTVCSPDELSAAITAYTVTLESHPFDMMLHIAWHWTWMSGLGITEMLRLYLQITVWSIPGLETQKNIKDINKTHNDAPVTLFK